MRVGRPGLSSEERERLKRLERENRELRRANEILKSASAFFAAELAISSVAEKLGPTPETVRKWVRRTEVDEGRRPGLSSEERERLKRLERENRELRRANEILKSAALDGLRR